jgi:hypothetical protein
MALPNQRSIAYPKALLFKAFVFIYQINLFVGFMLHIGIVGAHFEWV